MSYSARCSALFEFLCLFTPFLKAVVRAPKSAKTLGREQGIALGSFFSSTGIGDSDYVFALFARRIVCGERERENRNEKSSSHSIVTATLKSLLPKVEWDWIVKWLNETRQCIHNTRKIDPTFSDETVEIMATLKVLETNLRNELNAPIGIW